MRLVILLFTLFIVITPVHAQERFLDIQEVTSPGGITAWLVEDHTLPVIAMQIYFKGAGSVLESPDKQGLVQLLSNTMDEGAGDLDSTTFQKILLDNSITLRFTGGRDGFGGSLKTLTRNKESAFNLLTLALTKPRFDAEPVSRMKEANLSRIRSSMSDPEWMAARLINDRAFEGHPYALNAGGTLSTLAALTPNDLRAFQQTQLTKDRLVIGVAGDITPDDLAALLDQVFGALPGKAPAAKVSDFPLTNTGTTALYVQDIPQTVIEIMLPAFDRSDKDFYALQVMNYIFGGAGFGSRLMEEVREKQGLTYGIYSSLRDYTHIDTLSLSLSTGNDTAPQAMKVIREEMHKMVAEPVSKKELADAQSYLTGSMPLSLSSTDNIAGILLSLQEDGLPIDYLDHYADKINAVTSEDIARVSTRLLNPDLMTTIMVGNPAGITPTLTIETLPNVR